MAQDAEEEGVCEVGLAYFTPLVFITTGGMGKEAITFIAGLLSFSVLYPIAALWSGFTAPYLFLY